MYEQTTLLDTVKSTSSPGSEVGALPHDLLGSLMTSRCGQAPHPVSPSATQASSAEQTTIGTYGQSCAASLLSASLQSSLASRLRADLASTGSRLYALTWKERAMRSGPPICALRASARRTSASGSTGEASGWPTPDASALNDGQSWESNQARRDRLKHKHGNSNGAWLTVAAAATACGWPTATARDHKDGPSDGSVPVNGLLGRQAWDAKGAARMTADGEILTGSSAGMNGGARLDPAHSRWLMGFPPEWDDCAAMATPLSRRSRRRS